MTVNETISYEWRDWGLVEPAPPAPPAAGAYAAAVLADAPVIYWRHEVGQSAGYDSAVGAVRTGTYGGADVVPGLLPQGGDQSNRGRNSPSYATRWQFTGTDGAGPADGLYTIEKWFRSDFVPTAGDRGTRYGMMRFATGADLVGFTFPTDGTVSFGRGSQPRAAVAWPRDGEAHHLVGVLDVTHTRLYLDGIEVASAAYAATAFTVAVNHLGQNGSTGIPAMPGDFDEVAFYRAALPADRVLAHYLAAGGEVEADLVPGWVLNTPRSDGLVTWAIEGYGRIAASSKPTPVQVTVTLSAGITGAPPILGDRFRLTLSDDMADALGITLDDAVRFTGEVTDIRHNRNAGPSGQYVVTAVGQLGRSSRRTVTPKWPLEDDGARAARIIAAAGVVAGTVDPGTVQVLAQLQPATVAQLMDTLTDSTGGRFVEQLTGVVDWHDAEHRRGVPVTVALDASEILNDVEWSQHVGDILNVLDVTYGDPASRIRVTDPTSVDERDPFPGTLNTILVDAADAHSVGSQLIATRRDPVWQLPALQVDLRRTVDDAKRAQLLALHHGDRILVTGLPDDGPYAGAVQFFVEGHAETATKTAWRFAIAISDPTLSGVSLRWIDIDPDLMWIDVDPTLTWLDLATIENPDDLDEAGFFDGGTPTTTTWDRTFDGGTPTTTTWDRTIDGGTP